MFYDSKNRMNNMSEIYHFDIVEEKSTNKRHWFILEDIYNTDRLSGLMCR